MAGGAIRKINYRGPFSAEGVSANLFMYDKTFGSWQVKAKMANGRSQFALAVVDGSVLQYNFNVSSIHRKFNLQDTETTDFNYLQESRVTLL